MGCGNSYPATSPVVDPPTAEERKRCNRWNRYDELSGAIDDHPQGPTDEEADLIWNSEEDQLKPKDADKLPLLALAKDLDEWFR